MYSYLKVISESTSVPGAGKTTKKMIFNFQSRKICQEWILFWGFYWIFRTNILNEFNRTENWFVWQFFNDSLWTMFLQANESAPSINCGNSVCSENENDKEDYCRPRPLSEAYSVPPAARPITVSTSMNFASPPQLPPPNPTPSPSPCEMNYSVLPPPTPVQGTSISSTFNSQANGLDLPLQGYLKMHPAGEQINEFHKSPQYTR